MIQERNHQIKSVWKSFFCNLRETEFLQKELTFYPVLNLLRKVCLVLVIVLLYSNPIIQTWLIFTINLACSLIAIFKLQGPFHETQLNYHMSIQELILLIISCIHISYAYYYQEILELTQNSQTMNNSQLIERMQISELIEIICIYATMVLNFFTIIKFIKENCCCRNQVGINNQNKNKEELSTQGNNEKYYLLSQVELNKDKSKKLNNKQSTLSDEESLNPQEIVAGNKNNSIQQQYGIEFNIAEMNYNKERGTFQQEKQQDLFTCRNLNQSNKSIMQNMADALEQSNNKILFDDQLLKSAKQGYTKQYSHNNLSFHNIPDYQQNEEQKSQINIIDETSFMAPSQIFDNEYNQNNQAHENIQTLNQQEVLNKMRQKLNQCNTSINHLEELLNTYNVKTDSINYQLQDMTQNDEIDSTNRKELANDQNQQKESCEDGQLVYYFPQNEIDKSPSSPFMDPFEQESSEREEYDQDTFFEEYIYMTNKKINQDNSNSSFKIPSDQFGNNNDITQNNISVSKNSLKNQSSSEKKLLQQHEQFNNSLKKQDLIQEFNSQLQSNKNIDIQEQVLDPFNLNQFDNTENNSDSQQKNSVNKLQDYHFDNNNPQEYSNNNFIHYNSVKDYATASSFLNYNVEDIKEKDIKNLSKKKRANQSKQKEKKNVKK